MDYLREEIEEMCQDWVIQVIKNGEGKPIIEIKANREIMDTHIYLYNERFHIKRKKERSVICNKIFSVRTFKKYC